VTELSCSSVSGERHERETWQHMLQKESQSLLSLPCGWFGD
jgi:hypothetical protein